jgi:hypothetical protein
MQIPLILGSYESRSLISEAQRCINLYPERNPPDSPFPFTLYPTPGLSFIVTAPVVGPVRALYTASNGACFAVVGNNVYLVTQSYGFVLLGQINSYTGFVSIKDNTLVCVIVDGTNKGFAIDLTSGTFTYGAISQTNWYAANRVDYLDTYLLFSKTDGTGTFFTLSNVTYTMLTTGIGLDPLDVMKKTGGNDLTAGLAVMHREIWLIGTGTSEVWFDSGASDFAFQAMPGAFVEHGCAAVGSIAKYDLALYWLGQDIYGNSVVYRGAQYNAAPISTKAIDNEITSYSTKSDAIGFTYFQEGHAFYVLNFPSQDVTWVFDIAENAWHKRAWIDSNGNLHRWRGNCACIFNNKILVGDYQNGALYNLDLDTYLDNGAPVVRIRSFPHMVNENKRLTHRNLIAAFEVGDEMVSSTKDTCSVSLRCSDDAGRSYGDAVIQTLGNTGHYHTSVQWNRLGMARDRVYELSWSAPVKTALSGVYVDLIGHET